MISVMDMTTGLLESDYMAPAPLFASSESMPYLGACQGGHALHAGLHEHAKARSLHEGMPVAVVARNLDGFIARMTDSVR